MEYFERQKELEEKYGKMSVVLMQVGSFYEIYGVVTEELCIGHAENIGKLLSMQVAYRKGRDKQHGLDNPQMVGFPDYALGNYLEKILRANYTVAVYDQFDIPGKKEKGRKLVNIYSPSTFIESEINESQSGLAVISTQNYKCPISKTMLQLAHFVFIDLAYGTVNMTSIYNTVDDNKKVDTEIYRLIHTFNPSEIIYSGVQNIEKDYDVQNRKVYYQELNKTYTEPAYQNAFLTKIYQTQTNSMELVDSLGLTYHSDVLPYFIQGLQYAYLHDPLILQKIKKPKFIQTDKRLLLNNDSLYQLHIVQNGRSNEKTLFDVIDCNRTAMGKRLLKSRLLMPTSSKKILRKRYDRIEALLETFSEYEKKLKGIIDVDRFYRKMASKKLQPY
jgi:DNA mismatch repair protein MutS